MKHISIYFGSVVCIILIIIIYIIYISSTKRTNSTFDRFTNKITLIPGIFVAIGVILTYNIFTLNIEQASRTATFEMIDRGWLNVNKSIYELYDKCPLFVNSLYYPWQKTKLVSYKLKENISYQDKWYAVNYLSILMFQAWEDFITSSQIDETDEYVWIANFLQWANSPILRNVWSSFKSNYVKTTRDFGDLLFKETNRFTPKNESELTKFSKEIAESEEFKRILHERNN